jgi:hypothetical protein
LTDVHRVPIFAPFPLTWAPSEIDRWRSGKRSPCGLGLITRALGATSGDGPAGNTTRKRATTARNDGAISGLGRKRFVGRPEAETMPRWSAERRAPYVTGRGTPRKRPGVPRQGTPRCGVSAPSAFSALHPLWGDEQRKRPRCAWSPEKAIDRAAERWLLSDDRRRTTVDGWCWPLRRRFVGLLFDIVNK